MYRVTTKKSFNRKDKLRENKKCKNDKIGQIKKQDYNWATKKEVIDSKTSKCKSNTSIKRKGQNNKIADDKLKTLGIQKIYIIKVF